MGAALDDNRDDSLASRVAILGLGLIGGSIGLAIRERMPAIAVTGWDPDERTRERAADRGAVGTTTDSAAQAVRDADLVFLAAPLYVTVPLLQSIVPALTSSTVVTDVGSTKARIVREAEQILGGRFVGGHPMAGSELSGIDAARADLFASAPWILTPTRTTAADATMTVRQVVERMGAVPRICDPELHDEIVGSISHLPHILAYGLSATAERLVDPKWRDLAAGSFRDGTRVAGSPPAMWAEILMDNREALIKVIGEHQTWMADAKRALMFGDAGRLRAVLEQGHDSHRSFQKAEPENE